MMAKMITKNSNPSFPPPPSSSSDGVISNGGGRARSVVSNGGGGALSPHHHHHPHRPVAKLSNLSVLDDADDDHSRGGDGGAAAVRGGVGVGGVGGGASESFSEDDSLSRLTAGGGGGSVFPSRSVRTEDRSDSECATDAGATDVDADSVVVEEHQRPTLAASSARMLFGDEGSAWDRGVASIESVLNPSGPTSRVMTLEQREGLEELKRLLLEGSNHRSSLSLRPEEDRRGRPSSSTAAQSSSASTAPSSSASDARGGRPSSSPRLRHHNSHSHHHHNHPHPHRRHHRRGSSPHRSHHDVPKDLIETSRAGTPEYSDVSAYLASEFGGHSSLRKSSKEKLKAAAKNIMRAGKVIRTLRIKSASGSDLGGGGGGYYAPDEWRALSLESRNKLRKALSWTSLRSWKFDMLDVADRCEGCPLLLVGWAILASPHSQRAMARSCGKRGGGKSSSASASTSDGSKAAMNMNASSASATSKRRTSASASGSGGMGSGSGGGGYDFVNKCHVSEETICAFLRSIESDYNHDNPYHNNTHAADVLQTVHSLLRMGGSTVVCDPLEQYSVLLAAVVHDVGHPGQNNNFQINARTELAVRYNDVAVLENMHAASAFERIVGPRRREELDVLGGLDATGSAYARKAIINTVLHTDMAVHFSDVGSLKGLLASREERRRAHAPRKCVGMGTLGGGGSSSSSEKLPPLREDKDAVMKVMCFLLHVADISNPAKPRRVMIEWADRCLSEFFAQGDKENEMGLAMSPLCDRNSTSKPDSQIGFINYIVRPSFELLGQIVPGVGKEVMPVLASNLKYWEKEKAKAEGGKGSGKGSNDGGKGEDKGGGDEGGGGGGGGAGSSQ